MGRKRVSDLDKSKIVNLNFQGYNRDEKVMETRDSAGVVSKTMKMFWKDAESMSLEQLAGRYGLVNTLNELVSFAVSVRKQGTSVSELYRNSKLLEKVMEFVSLDKLPGLVEFAENAKNPAYMDVVVRLHMIEKRTRNPIDVILKQAEAAEATITSSKQENEKIRREIEDSKKQRQTTREADEADEAKRKTELQERLRQSKLTLEKVDAISRTVENLRGHGFDLSQWELLHNLFAFLEEAGENPKTLLELAKKKESLHLQVQAENRALTEARENNVRLQKKMRRLERRYTRAKLSIAKHRILESKGFRLETLEDIMKLARDVGEPTEVLRRVELLKTSEEAKREIENLNAQIEALKTEYLEALKESLQKLTNLQRETAALVNDKLPSMLSETGRFFKEEVNALVLVFINLAQEITELSTAYTKLIKDYNACKKLLDDAISWTTLLQNPEKLPGDTVITIFFQKLLPTLEVWCKNRPLEQKVAIAQQLQMNAISLCGESAAHLMEKPEQASRVEVVGALSAFIRVTWAFNQKLVEWCASHKFDQGVKEISEICRQLNELTAQTVNLKV